MASTGTKATGFADKKYGPFMCSNCTKFEDGVCSDKDVAADPDIPKDRRMVSGKVRVNPNDCCNEFLSRNKDGGKGFGSMMVIR